MSEVQAGTNATLVARQDINPELAVFTVRPDETPIKPFLPGQYTTLGVNVEPGATKPKLLRRAYSIASSPLQNDVMEFYIVLVAEGELTPKLWQLSPGDRLWLDPRAKGNFILEDNIDPNSDLVMLSTGTGLAPFISMLRTFRGKNRWRKFVIVNGVRYSKDLGYCEELETAQKQGDVVYVPLVSREPDYPGLKGRTQVLFNDGVYESLVGAPLDPARCHVFLCGNPEMIDSVQAYLEGRGFKTHSKRDPGNIHLERYW